MSASTAAIPITTTNANHGLSLDSHSSQDVRKRTVVVAKKKSTPEMLVEGGVNGVPDDKRVVSGKDLSHTFRGESVVERLKDTSEAKKDLVASAATAARRKKSAPKPERAKWETPLSVLAKVCFLVLALFGTGQLIWRWRNGDLSFAALDIESRQTQVDGLKETAKMLQVQLDILDKKLGSAIDKAKKDITKQVEDRGSKLEAKMKTLEGKTDKLDKSLAELRDMGFVSKKEFEEFLTELKKKKGLDGSDNDISLDDISQFAKEIVEKEIEKHAADGLGMVDYALGSAGAKVVKHSEPYTSGKGTIWFAGCSGVHPTAHKMLEPSFGQPGECFALQGSSGFVEIKLRAGIVPEAVTLEHVAKRVAYDRSSGPKDCQVTAWYQGPEDDPDKQSDTMTVLAEFSYDLEKNNAQTFKVDRTDSRIINMVRLDISSNHGNSRMTCIYRFRVHGSEPGSLGAAVLQA